MNPLSIQMRIRSPSKQNLAVSGAFSDDSSGSIWVGLAGTATGCVVGTVFVLVGFTLLATHPVVFDRVAGVARGKRLKVDKVRIQEPLVKKLRVIIESAGREEGYTMILQRGAAGVIYTREALDITDLIIARYNKKK